MKNLRRFVKVRHWDQQDYIQGYDIKLPESIREAEEYFDETTLLQIIRKDIEKREAEQARYSLIEAIKRGEFSSVAAFEKV